MNICEVKKVMSELMIIVGKKKNTSKPARNRHLLIWVKIVFEKLHFVNPIYIEGYIF